MIFNSIEFSIFFPVVFLLYWFVFNKKLNHQNILLLVSSYIFYGWWDWRFLSLIIISSVSDFIIGLLLDNNEAKQKRKLLLLASISINLGLLFFFKYYNFFLASFRDAFTLFGQELNTRTLNIILPVGISFYTFQTLSYSIDRYHKKIDSSKDLISFMTFVSFFPQLVAGPIERASKLLPQFNQRRVFNYDFAVSGVRLIVWGLFKKLVIADNAAIIVDGVFGNYQGESSISLILGTLLFTFQIYCDFSGYSDIAIGLGRTLGFSLTSNFKFPYISKNISEFWKKWHISLSTWFRDYMYIPLGGSHGTKKRAVRNVFIVFVISGFWHGANWTFIAWGILHGLLYLPLFLKKKSLRLKSSNKIKIFLSYIFNFGLICLTWIFFRATSINEAFDFIQKIFFTEQTGMFIFQTKKYLLITGIAFSGIIALMVAEIYYFRRNQYDVMLPSVLLILTSISIAFAGALKNHSDFIYFQF